MTKITKETMTRKQLKFFLTRLDILGNFNLLDIYKDNVKEFGKFKSL